jgi:hypothetical protein
MGIASNAGPALRAGAVLAGALLLESGTAWGQSSSASFRLHQSTLDMAGGESSSASYSDEASLGQELCVGTSSSPLFVLQSGFWSFAGSGLVPVYLLMDKNEQIREHLDLTWSGNNSPYTIYRSADCADVFSTFFTSEPTNSYTDASSLPDDLSCYNVLATAPGPFAPRTGTAPATGKETLGGADAQAPLRPHAQPQVHAKEHAP